MALSSMPKDDESRGGSDLVHSPVDIEAVAGSAKPAPSEPVLPLVVPPQTSAPVQFNQQLNLSVQQIPSSAWDRLSPEQIVDISKMIVNQIDATDQRHFDYAMENVKRSASGKKVALWCGGLIFLIGVGATTFLATHGMKSAR
jgi:hypothetical protein